MPCGPRGQCKHAYRKPGKNTLHCDIQTKQGGKWDFCAHQYLCGMTKRYELSREANSCPMPKKEAKEAPKPKKTAEKKTKKEG